MTAKGPEQGINAHDIIDDLLTEFAGDWHTVKEISELDDGETKLSVLQRHFPEQEVLNLKRDDVLQQIERRYWHDLYCDAISSPTVIESLLRAVFYLGQSTAVKLAQEVAEVRFADGIMGKQTANTINKIDPKEYSNRLTQRLVDFLEQKQTAKEDDRPSKDSNPPQQKTSANDIVLSEELEQAVNQMQLPFNERKTLTESLSKIESQISKGVIVSDSDTYKLSSSIQELINNFKTPKAESRIFFDRFNQWLNSQVQKKDIEEKEPDPISNKKPFNVDAISKKSTSDIWTIKDQLGYESYAQSIAKLIVENKAEPPLTVSIQAPWGQGKTSLMRMIKHKLEQGLQSTNDKPEEEDKEETNEIPGTQTRLNNLGHWIANEKNVADKGEFMLKVKPGTMPCVWFNPLYFQNSQQIWAGLAHAILHQLAEQLDSKLERERFWFRLRLTRINAQAIRRDIHKLILERLLPKGLIWFGLFISLFAAQWLNNIKLTQMFFDYWWLNSLPILGGAVHIALSWLKNNKDLALDDKLMKYVNEPDYEGDLGLLHLVEHDLDRALNLLLGPDGRLTVFIDDLDRCTPDTVTDILLAINQFISVQHRKIYFILGMDTHMVAMAIETAAEKQAAAYNKNSHRSKGYGWRFMEKFVQLPFFIPRIDTEQAKNFLNNLLKSSATDLGNSEEMRELKRKVDQTQTLSALQDLVVEFKSSHNIDFVPDLDAKVASKMIDFTTQDNSETLNKLINAALVDLELNPREMKRFLNVARLLFVRIDHQSNVSSDEHMLKIVRATHLILNWPQCLRWLQGNAHCFTLKGEKISPVDSVENLFQQCDDYQAWYEALKLTWGEVVANTVAQADFYAFGKSIHNSPPSLSHIFEARIF